MIKKKLRKEKSKNKNQKQYKWLQIEIKENTKVTTIRKEEAKNTDHKMKGNKEDKEELKERKGKRERKSLTCFYRVVLGADTQNILITFMGNIKTSVIFKT